LVLGLGLLFFLIILGLTFYTRTENFTRWARDQAVAAVNASIRGSVSVERLELLWSRLTLHNVALRYEESEIVKIPRLQISFSLLPLVWGRLQISRIDALQPRAALTEDRNGSWDLIEALAPREPDQETTSALTVLVKSLRLRDADLALRQVSADEKLYRLKNLNLEGNLAIRPAGLAVEVSEITAGLVAQGQPELRVKGAISYRQNAASPGILNVKDFWAVSRNSRVKLNGQVAQGDTVKVSARAALEKLAPADIAYFVPEWPLKQDLVGNLTIDGALDALRGNLELTAVGAKFVGKVQADVTQDRPQYTATIVLSEVDLRQWLGGKDLAGVVNATVEASGTGFELQNTSGKMRLEMRSTEVQGWSLGTVSMDGRLQNSLAAVDGTLKGKLGGASWSGKIALSDRRPPYELALSVNDLDVQKAIPNGNSFQGKLNLQGTVKGSGLSLAEMNTRADLRILPSTLGPIQIEQGALNAALSDKRIRVARVSLSTSDSSLTVRGEIGVDAKMAGKLDYRLRTADVSPWLSLVDKKGAGSLDLAGVAEGNLVDLRTEGTARMASLQVEGFAVKDGNVKFALAGSKNQFFPQGSVTASLAGVDAGVALRRIDASAKLSSQPSQSIQLNLNVQDAHDRKHSLSGTVDFLHDSLAVRLSQASLAAPDGVWKLSHPTTVTKRDDAFLIEQFALKNGDREVSLNGRAGLSGKQDVTLNVDRLPVETLTGFLSRPPKMSGLLAVQGRIAGTAAAPEITATARVSEAMIAGQSYAGADAEVNYKNKRVSARLVVRQDSAHTLNGTGVLPLNLSWQNGWRADFADGIELRAQSAGVSVAFLNAFGGKTVENISGEVSLDLLARGSVKQPDVRGTFRLHEGKLKLVPLGVDVHEIAFAGNMDSRNVNFRELRAKAKDGEIKGSGSLALKDFDVSAVKLSLNAERWPAIATQRHQVNLGGNVDVQGSLTAPRVTGQLTVVEGSLRPDLAFLDQSKIPLKRDETIVVVNDAAGHQARTQAQEATASNDNQVFNKLTLDLTLRAPGNFWIRHPDLVSELSGNLRATKRPDRHIDLTGRIDIVRGSLVFQGRRFQLSRGAIQFTGGDKINPALDIQAQYRLPDYEVDAVIGGTAEKPSLTLASNPRLEQADILALLLFGRPINALNPNERGSVQQSAVSIASGYAAGKIANSVSQALGLDTLGLDVRELDFSGGRVGFGRYVGGKTYVSLSQQVTGERGREVSMEYQVAPDWKIGTSTNSTGTNGIDIIWHKRY
jgi:autotransporter translocation and assembly factor TamB